MDNEQPTLRDSLTASIDALESGVAPAVDAPPIETAAPAASPAVETAAEARARDEAGRFAKTDAKPTPAPAATPLAPTPVTHPRPDSWKKEFEPHWEKLDPTLKAYIRQRESEYQTGVSTYKGEAENAKQLNEAIAPFLPNLQRHNIQPTQWIRNLGTAHERLALGSPQEKVQMGVQLIRDYGIDPQALFQVLSGQAPQYQQQPQQYAPPPQDIERIVEQKLTQKEIDQEYRKFLAEAPEKYPHYETVKSTMAGLLQADLAQDYPSAYAAALRHPRHADLFDAMQKQQGEEAAAKTREEAAARAAGARNKAVSVKSSTPSGQMTTGTVAQGLRDQLSEAFDSVTSSRV